MIQDVPPQALKGDLFAAQTLIAARKLITELLQKDKKGDLYSSMCKETVTFDRILVPDGNDYSFKIKCRASNGEIFISASLKDKELFAEQALLPKKALCLPSYRDREDESFIFGRSLTHGRVLVVDDGEYEIFQLQKYGHETYALIFNPNEADTLIAVNAECLGLRQPLTHWPTRVLLDSIHSHIKKMVNNLQIKDNEDSAIQQYMIEKALTTGHIDTVAINPITVLKSVKEYLDNNFTDNVARSLSVIIENYSSELESLNEKYADLWPRISRFGANFD